MYRHWKNDRNYAKPDFTGRKTKKQKLKFTMENAGQTPIPDRQTSANTCKDFEHDENVQDYTIESNTMMASCNRQAYKKHPKARYLGYLLNFRQNPDQKSV